MGYADDPGFQAANDTDRHNYLSAVDPHYASAPTETQQQYLASLRTPQPKSPQDVKRNFFGIPQEDVSVAHIPDPPPIRTQYARKAVMGAAAATGPLSPLAGVAARTGLAVAEPYLAGDANPGREAAKQGAINLALESILPGAGMAARRIPALAAKSDERAMTNTVREVLPELPPGQRLYDFIKGTRGTGGGLSTAATGLDDAQIALNKIHRPIQTPNGTSLPGHEWERISQLPDGPAKDAAWQSMYDQLNPGGRQIVDTAREVYSRHAGVRDALEPAYKTSRYDNQGVQKNIRDNGQRLENRAGVDASQQVTDTSFRGAGTTRDIDTKPSVKLSDLNVTKPIQALLALLSPARGKFVGAAERLPMAPNRYERTFADIMGQAAVNGRNRNPK